MIRERERERREGRAEPWQSTSHRPFARGSRVETIALARHLLTAIICDEYSRSAARACTEGGVDLGLSQPARPVERPAARIAQVASIHAVATRPLERPRT